MELLKKYHFFEKNLKIRESSDIRTLLRLSKKSSNQVRPAVIGSRYYSILQSKSTDTKLRNIKKNLRYYFQCIFFSFFSRRWRSISCSFFCRKNFAVSELWQSVFNREEKAVLLQYDDLFWGMALPWGDA